LNQTEKRCFSNFMNWETSPMRAPWRRRHSLGFGAIGGELGLDDLELGALVLGWARVQRL